MNTVARCAKDSDAVSDDIKMPDKSEQTIPAKRTTASSDVEPRTPLLCSQVLRSSLRLHLPRSLHLPQQTICQIPPWRKRLLSLAQQTLLPICSKALEPTLVTTSPGVRLHLPVTFHAQRREKAMLGVIGMMARQIPVKPTFPYTPNMSGKAAMMLVTTTSNHNMKDQRRTTSPTKNHIVPTWVIICSIRRRATVSGLHLR